MKLTFRWYGKTDSIPLVYIKQIPQMTGVVTAVYDVPVGEVWPLQNLIDLKQECQKHGLNMEVIESVPVHDEIKLGGERKDEYIDNYIQTIKNLGKIGVKVICYNFMPVFDWLRTDLDYINPDGSSSLLYDHQQILKLDPKKLSLPGWDESYTSDQMAELIEKYQKLGRKKLFENLVYFLNRIMPVCQQVEIKMAIHPDDPPWEIFGLPRIISTEDDLDALFESVPSKNNTSAFCTGSFGANPKNDVVKMIDKFSSQNRIVFAHLRNIKFDGEKSFHETAHISKEGSLDMFEIVSALVKNGFDGYVRPDHGRTIFGEKAKPGYGLYDRALGATYLLGLFEASEKNLKK